MLCRSRNLREKGQKVVGEAQRVGRDYIPIKAKSPADLLSRVDETSPLKPQC